MEINKELKKKLIEYYEREDVQERIFEISENREVVPRFNDFFGKRPSILFYKSDIGSLARKGMTSLHSSVELWKDPLLLESKKIDLNELRKAWDFIIDIDFSYLPYSLIATQVIIDFLRKKFNIKKISVKYSGNLGFHIGISNESFPSSYKGKEIASYFPEMPRILANYLFENTKELIAKEILVKEGVLYEEPSIIKKILVKAGVNNINEVLKKKIKIENKELNFDKIIELLFKKYEGDELLNKLSKFLSLDLLVPKVDTIAISSRHLIRSVYSFNEKSGLVSIPIDLDTLMDLNVYEITSFVRKNANLDNIKANLSFLKEKEKPVKLLLFIEEALEWNEKKIVEELRKIKRQLSKEKTVELKRIENKLNQKFFPPCIKNILKGLKDGKKRALFLLVNFLYYVGYSFEEIEEIVWDWNKRNPEKLKDSYIKAQLKWFKKIFKQNKFYMLPNCNYEEYYKDLQICEKDKVCNKIKNPLSYVRIVSNISEKEKSKKEKANKNR